MFWQAIHDDPRLEYLGVVDDIVLVHGPRYVFEVPPRAILDFDEDELLAVLLETRKPIVLSQMARIVGYFSNSRNWNRSKIAEQRDRRKGEYRLTGELPTWEPPEDFVTEALTKHGATASCEVPQASPTISARKS